MAWPFYDPSNAVAPRVVSDAHGWGDEMTSEPTKQWRNARSGTRALVALVSLPCVTSPLEHFAQRTLVLSRTQQAFESAVNLHIGFQGNT